MDQRFLQPFQRTLLPRLSFRIRCIHRYAQPIDKTLQFYKQCNQPTYPGLPQQILRLPPARLFPKTPPSTPCPILHILIESVFIEDSNYVSIHPPRLTFVRILEKNCPAAVAWVTGKGAYSELSGLVKFYCTPYDGVLVEAEIFGLPNISTQGSSDFYGMHIHQNGNCSDSYEKSGSHFSLTDTFHPQHTGDLIPLLGNQGYAWTSFYDKRFTIDDIIGKSVIIHSQRDDFTTQPSGDSGEKIGCGVIKREG